MSHVSRTLKFRCCESDSSICSVSFNKKAYVSSSDNFPSGESKTCGCVCFWGTFLHCQPPEKQVPPKRKTSWRLQHQTSQKKSFIAPPYPSLPSLPSIPLPSLPLPSPPLPSPPSPPSPHPMKPEVEHSKRPAKPASAAATRRGSRAKRRARGGRPWQHGLVGSVSRGLGCPGWDLR